MKLNSLSKWPTQFISAQFVYVAAGAVAYTCPSGLWQKILSSTHKVFLAFKAPLYHLKVEMESSVEIATQVSRVESCCVYVQLEAAKFCQAKS
jgi:hypothetical protein